MNTVEDKVLADLNAKDDLAFKLGDTLDVKASITMVLITFLGTQTAYFFNKFGAGTTHIIQLIAIACLVVATIATIVELWPRDYMTLATEARVVSRVKELQNHYAQFDDDVEPNVLRQLTKEETEWAIERITTNMKINSRKSDWLSYAFYATAGAIVMNVLTVAWPYHALIASWFSRLS